MNKTIIIDNQEYELIPKNSYKVGDWVIYSEKNIVRRIVEDDAYSDKNGGSDRLNRSFGEWMTEGAAKEWRKEIKRKATEYEIKTHLAKMAKEKGLIKGAKVKRLSVLDNSTFVTIVQEDDDYYLEQDEYCKSGIILYSKGQWVTKIEEPVFTFGGHGVSFKRVEVGNKYNFRTIEVTCKGETGTNSQISCILTHYFRPIQFGNVSVKSYSDKSRIDEVTIGCLTGKYSELVAIFDECQRLLK